MHAPRESAHAMPRLRTPDDSSQSEWDIPSPAPRGGTSLRMDEVQASPEITRNSFHDERRRSALGAMPINAGLTFTPSPKRPQRRRLFVGSPMSPSDTAVAETIETRNGSTRRLSSPPQDDFSDREDTIPPELVRARTIPPACDNRHVRPRGDINDRIDTPGTQQGDQRESRPDVFISRRRKGQRGFLAEYDELRQQYQSLRDKFHQLQQQINEEKQRQPQAQQHQDIAAPFASPAPSAAPTVECVSVADCLSATSASSPPKMLNWFATDDGDTTIVVDVTVEPNSPLPLPQPISNTLPNPLPNPIAFAWPCPTPPPAPCPSECDAAASVASWPASVEYAGDTSAVVVDTVSPPVGAPSATMRGLLRAVTSLSEPNALEAKRCAEPLISPLALELCRATRPFARQLLLMLVRATAGSGGTVTPAMCAESVNDLLAEVGVRDVRATRRLCSRIAATCEDAEMEPEGDGEVRRVPYASFITRLVQLADGER